MEEATDIIEQLAGSDTSASLATFQFIPPRHAAHSVPPSNPVPKYHPVSVSSAKSRMSVRYDAPIVNVISDDPATYEIKYKLFAPSQCPMMK